MADTLVNTLYPPTVDTFQPAFVYTSDALVTFSLSPFNAGSDIQYVHVTVVDQRNNENVLIGHQDFKTENVYRDYGVINGIFIAPLHYENSVEEQNKIIRYNANTNLYTLHIPPSLLRKTETINNKKFFNVGQYYKVQIRFDNGYFRNNFNESYNSFLNVTKAINENPNSNDSKILKSDLENYMTVGRPYFSEWSEITLIKPILPFEAIFSKFDSVNLETHEITSSTLSFNPGLIRISAQTSFKTYDENNNIILDENEHLEKYRIRVYEVNNSEEIVSEIIKDSKIIYTIPTKINNKDISAINKQSILNQTKQNYEYGINYLLDMTDGYPDQKYLLLIDFWSNNEYHTQEKRYIKINTFGTKEWSGSPKWNNRKEIKYQINTTSDYKDAEEYRTVEVNQEDGIAKINLDWNNLTYTDSEGIPFEYDGPGTIHIRRGCSKDNFKKWDLIYQKHFETMQDKSLSFEDYTLCSLYIYRYTAQFEPDDNTIWTPVYESHDVYPQFYEMLLERKNRQIAIRYDGKVSSLKPVVNRQKIDTLGGKYPRFVENAQMNYKQLQIQGIISAEGDHNRKFLNEFEGEWAPVRTGTSGDGTGIYTMQYQSYYQDEINKYDETFGSHYLIRNDTAADGEFGYNPEEKYKYGTTDTTTNAGNRYLDDKNGKKRAGIFDNSQESFYKKSIFYDEDDREDSSYYQHDLYPSNHWYWERIFREELTKWLNDGEPKLFRSMPEGNIAVMLTDINLSPYKNDRQLYNFSATMYEVGDGYSLEDLDRLGIIDIPKVSSEYDPSSDGSSIDIEDDDDETVFNVFHKPMQLYYPELKTASLITGSGSWDSVQWNSLPINRKIELIHADKSFLGRTVISNYSMHDIKIQFTSPPHMYIIDKNGNFQMITENEFNIEDDDDNKDLIYYSGYQIKLFGTIPGTGENASGTFFVNDRGYFQVPSDTLIDDIRLVNPEDEIIVDFISRYQTSFRSGDTVTKKENIRTIVGQWGGVYPVNTTIGDSIYKKYQYDQYINMGSEVIKSNSQALEYWKGVSLDITPYSLINIQYEGEDFRDSETILVGRTGVLSLFDNTPIQNIKFLGKRMFEADASRAKYLDDWEYVLSDTIISTDQSSSTTVSSTWVDILENNVTQETDIPVEFNYWNLDASLPVGVTTEMFKFWLEDNYSDNIGNLPANPLKNHVYSIIINDNIQHMIYYLDSRWYPIEITNKNSETKTTGLAAVPVYGYINYTGNIVRSSWA